MSDDAKDDGTPEVKLDAAGGFMPDPPPPSLSPEEAGVPAESTDGEIEIANTMPDGTVAVPPHCQARAGGGTNSGGEQPRSIAAARIADEHRA